MKNEITNFRMEKGWTLDFMAEKSGISKNTWINLNNGVAVRPLTEQKAKDFLKANGWHESRRFCVIYQRGQYENLDETWFDDFGKARLFCNAQAQEIRPRDRKAGAFCLVSNDYDPETGEYYTVLYDALAERDRAAAERERERDEYEAQA